MKASTLSAVFLENHVWLVLGYEIPGRAECEAMLV